ncbi:MAG TPA: cysteine desulfurase family protein [Sphaerochaeta sp.]|nr:cysteine desulfurase family protein [Sphaerochaeta sp.]
MTEIHYFDNAATTPMNEQAIQTYASVARTYFGNPSALHQEGIKAKELLEELRETSARLLDVPSNSIFFTSGGTESNAIVLNHLLWKPQKAEIILTNIEHPSIKEYGTFFRQLGWKVIYLDAPKGFVSPIDLAKALTDKTRLVCCLLVNNVTGSIQDIQSLVSVVREKEASTGRKIHFHTDAVQALGKIPFSLTTLGVDSASFSAHKIHGPRGVGILYNSNTGVTALNRAGEQEKGLRGGTENLSGIAAMVSAMEDVFAKQDSNLVQVKTINALLRDKLSFLPILSPPKLCSPYILTVSVKPWPSEVFTRLLYAKGFCVSSGSACSNNSKQKSQGVLIAMQVHPQDVKCSLRLSFSGDTTIEEAELLSQAIETTYRELA